MLYLLKLTLSFIATICKDWRLVIGLRLSSRRSKVPQGSNSEGKRKEESDLCPFISKSSLKFGIPASCSASSKHSCTEGEFGSQYKTLAVGVLLRLPAGEKTLQSFPEESPFSIPHLHLLHVN